MPNDRLEITLINQIIHKIHVLDKEMHPYQKLASNAKYLQNLTIGQRSSPELVGCNLLSLFRNDDVTSGF